MKKEAKAEPPRPVPPSPKARRAPSRRIPYVKPVLERKDEVPADVPGNDIPPHAGNDRRSH